MQALADWQRVHVVHMHYLRCSVYSCFLWETFERAPGQRPVATVDISVGGHIRVQCLVLGVYRPIYPNLNVLIWHCVRHYLKRMITSVASVYFQACRTPVWKHQASDYVFQILLLKYLFVWVFILLGTIIHCSSFLYSAHTRHSVTLKAHAVFPARYGTPFELWDLILVNSSML